jgi:hypothetical protein
LNFETSSLRIARAVGVALAAAVLAACDGKPRESPPDPAKGQRQPVERAKGVERSLDDAARKRIDEADRQSN